MTGQLFGASVSGTASKFGSVAAIGAQGYKRPGESRLSGRAYVFERRHGRDDWPEVAALDNCFADAYPFSHTIEAVAAAATPDGLTVVMAGRHVLESTNAIMTSAACVYHRDDSGDEPGPWVLQAAILPDPPDGNSSVTVSTTLHASPSGRTTLVFGPAYGRTAQVYERAPGASAWVRSDVLEGDPFTSFGRSVALTTIGEHDVLLVGAEADSRFGSRVGAGYVYARTQTEDRFVLRAVLGTRDTPPSTGLGFAAAISSEGIAVLTSPGGQQGWAYRYDLSELFPTVSAEAPPAASGPGLRVSGASPARGATSVSFALAEAAPVRLRVLDALGREVAVVSDGVRSAGEHREVLDVRRWPVGVYAVVLEAAGRREVARVTVVR